MKIKITHTNGEVKIARFPGLFFKPMDQELNGALGSFVTLQKRLRADAPKRVDLEDGTVLELYQGQ